MKYIYGSLYSFVFLLALRTWCSPADDFLKSYKMVKVSEATFELTLPVLTSLEPIFVKKNVSILKAYLVGTYEVSNFEWNLCFKDSFCKHPANQKESEKKNNPVARVNWHDAFQFSQWISQKTHLRFRLPTEEEWVNAAGFNELTKLNKRKSPEKITHEREYFGKNKIGIFDLEGNVWEWTLSCWHASTELTLQERTASDLNTPLACPIRIVRGETRTHVSDIVSDTYNGGCGTLTPTANLGFRLIREIE